MGKTYINMPSLSSQPERKKMFNMTLARVKTAFDKSFICLVPGSCSSRSVMFWVRFTVDIFPLSEQDHPALADTTCDGCSSRDRAEEVDALQASAWWPQEQVSGTSWSGAGRLHPIPHQREDFFLSMYLSKPRMLNSFSSLPFLHQSFLKTPNSLSYQPSLPCCPKALCVPKLNSPEST